MTHIDICRKCKNVNTTKHGEWLCINRVLSLDCKNIDDFINVGKCPFKLEHMMIGNNNDS